MVVSIADAFGAAHHGEAPIIVMPDLNGGHLADSECIRTKDGKDTESYLSADVVSWVRRHYAASVGDERWWIAGLSEGGLCSLMLSLRHPTVYSAFGDFSGLIRPIVDHLSPAASNEQLYGTDTSAMREHEPLWLLTHRSFDGLSGWFECGFTDRTVRAAQSALVAAAEGARIPVRDVVLPGGHAWSVWSAALRSMLPWLWTRRGSGP